MIVSKKKYQELEERYQALVKENRKLKTSKDLTRRILSSVNLLNGDIDEREDRMDFLAQMEQIQSKEHFHTLVNELLKYQNQEALSQVDDIEKLNFARGTINGISLVSDFVESFSAQYTEETKTEEKFDEHAVI